MIPYGYYGYGINGGLVVAALVLALIGTIVMAASYFGAEKRGRFSGFQLKVFKHVNFQHFIIPTILKFLYTFFMLLVVLLGIFTLFSNFLSGLLLLLAGPLVLRVSYELIMMVFSIHDGIQETNHLLRNISKQMKGGQGLHKAEEKQETEEDKTSE